MSRTRTDIIADLNALAENPTGDAARLQALADEAAAAWERVGEFADALIEAAALTGTTIGDTGRAVLADLTALHNRIDMAMDRAVRACIAVA